MKAQILVALAALIAAAPGAVPAQAARPVDKQVQANLRKVVQGIKELTPSASTDARADLQSLAAACERASNRFSRSHAASSEVERCLKAARAVDGSPLRGAEEWAKTRSELLALALAYNIDWSADPAGWKASRMNDQEVEALLYGLAVQARKFSKGYNRDLEKDESLTPDARRELAAAAEALVAAARDLDLRFTKGEDVSRAIASLLAANQAVGEGVEGRPLSLETSDAWISIQSSIESFPAAFGTVL